jgi:fatty acid CoA ligase FadD9
MVIDDAATDRLIGRIRHLQATDQQFAAALPDDAISAKLERPGARLVDLVSSAMIGYADRPAVGQRAVRYQRQPGSGRTYAELLPRFETITYRQLWQRACALAAAWAEGAVRPGDRVALLGFGSVDFTTVELALIRLGAVSVPLQIGAPLAALRAIVAESTPTVMACSVEYLPDAVELALAVPALIRLTVIDHHREVDEEREVVERATTALQTSDRQVALETLADVIARGRQLPTRAALLSEDRDPLALLMYTSGSTGAPKGARYPEHLVASSWRRSSVSFGALTTPAIALCFMPLSHSLARHLLFGALGSGGTAFFAAKSDMSTLLDDLALVRPTELSFVPRVWEMLFGQLRTELDRRCTGSVDEAATEAEVIADFSERVLGGRVLSGMTSSAPLSPDLKSFIEAVLDIHLIEGYGSTETGAVTVDNHVRQPPVTAYRLVDVPELGYFSTDRPHPRGELLVKSQRLFDGYYERPDITAEVFDSEGFYRTGDIMAQTGPDQLVWLTRRNDVLKLSQGEFVTVSRLESVFTTSALVRQVYIYGNSSRPYLLAVIVPGEDALDCHNIDEMRPMISNAFNEIARAEHLQSYEVPRAFIIETTPFTHSNGLLTGVGKLARPALESRYGPSLEDLYSELDQARSTELRDLRRAGADKPALETITRAAAAVLDTPVGDLSADMTFTGMGGDSLSALTFADLLHSIFDVTVPVGDITGPAADLRSLARLVDSQREENPSMPAYGSVHPNGVGKVAAADLTLNKFIDPATLADAATLPRSGLPAHTVLLTGATGFLGRFLALEWLERLAPVNGTLICLVRGKTSDDARRRLDATFTGADERLLARYRKLSVDRIEVVAGDKGETDLGLDQETWQRLAETVDLVVDCAAQVNHVLPYSQVFGPNVVGTAELIRLAVTAKLKRYNYVSTVGVLMDETVAHPEDADIRLTCPVRDLDDSYANGYTTSKWAGEVLLREANDLCGLPVGVYRCDMLLAHSFYKGHLNLSGLFTRLILSVVNTGVAPASFYELDACGARQAAHYDGLPVDFAAQAISTLGACLATGHRTYNVVNPHDDGIGLDEVVDWLIAAGHSIERIPDYADWLHRFEIAMRALPVKQRKNSSLALLRFYQRPEKPVNGAPFTTEEFRGAVHQFKVGSNTGIPHITVDTISGYLRDLDMLDLF